MRFTFSPSFCASVVAVAAVSLLSACGGGGGGATDANGNAVPVSVTVSKLSNAASIGLDQTFLTSGVAVSSPNAMSKLSWSVTKLTTGAPDLVITNQDCAVASMSTKTLNSMNESTWGCDATIKSPSSLAAPSSYRLTLLGVDSKNNSASSYQEITISAGSNVLMPIAPTATTAPSLSVFSGDDVGLTCFGAGGVVSAVSNYRYQWILKDNTSGLLITATNPTPSTLTFKAPAVRATSTVTYECRVTDDNLMTGTSSTVVTINQPAVAGTVANAGGVQSATQGTLVVLDGTASTSTGTLFYSWTQTNGPTVALNGVNTSKPSFLAPNVLVSTPLSFQLIAQTTFGTTATASPSEIDTAVVYVNPQPTLVLMMTPSLVVKSGLATSLSVSVTPATAPLYYEWSQVSGPSVTMGAANTGTTSFTAPVVLGGAVEMVFTVKVSRFPIATAAPGEIYTSDVVVSVTP